MGLEMAHVGRDATRQIVVVQAQRRFEKEKKRNNQEEEEKRSGECVRVEGGSLLSCMQYLHNLKSRICCEIVVQHVPSFFIRSILDGSGPDRSFS